MKFIELKVTYEWFTPKGKRRIRHENYKVLKMKFS